MKKVTIVDYGSGNLHSIAKALEAVAPRGCRVEVSESADDILSASYVVLPGVGAFGDCVNGVRSLEGVEEALEKVVLQEKKPFLGICVGMQMLAQEGVEYGKHRGLGWIKGRVVEIKSLDKQMKIPHMGWNEIGVLRKHPIFQGVNEKSNAYFVHSFHLECEEKKDIIAQVEYGYPLTAAIARENIVAVQFHPEKSQEVGLKLLGNFLSL